MTTERARPRGRPRSFDRDAAVAVAQRLFHAHGYDAVSVGDVTKALGINPPSFYAAFGSKAALYEEVLRRYTAAEGVPLAALMRRDRPVAEGLAAVLEEAARRYAADPDAAGCLVVEGTRCTDPGARSSACALNRQAEDAIRAFVAERHPDEAGAAADYVSTAMSGLSAKARNGYDADRLLATARLAGLALRQMLPA